MKHLRILVCFYKEKFLIPKNDFYFNIQCGKDETNLDLGMNSDNTGSNISIRNKYWSEITGLYWAWKNLEPVNYVGLCSYRRFFNFRQNPQRPIEIISSNQVEEINKIVIPDLDLIFTDYDVVVPKYYTYAYTIRKVCSMNYNDDDFNELENVILELSPEYFDAYKNVMYDTNKAIGHNMFIMKWETFNEYCEWVFSILLTLEQRINPKDYPINQVRVFGYMHELLLAVYIRKNNLRQFYSQLTWICDDAKGFKFNKLVYRVLANLFYNFTRFLKPFHLLADLIKSIK